MIKMYATLAEDFAENAGVPNLDYRFYWICLLEISTFMQWFSSINVIQ